MARRGWSYALLYRFSMLLVRRVFISKVCLLTSHCVSSHIYKTLSSHLATFFTDRQLLINNLLYLIAKGDSYWFIKRLYLVKRGCSRLAKAEYGLLIVVFVFASTARSAWHARICVRRRYLFLLSCYRFCCFRFVFIHGIAIHYLVSDLLMLKTAHEIIPTATY